MPSSTAHSTHWLVRETIGLWRRTLSRLDVSSRTLFALIDRGSCFAGTLFELALAADRSYMQALPDDRAERTANRAVRDECGRVSDGERAHAARQPFLCRRRRRRIASTRCSARKPPARPQLVTFTPDDIDWDDEIRLALEERASLSPDALTGMEASLRFTGPETMHTRIFGRLSAWQNWVFQRPNAVGEEAR